MIACVPLNWTAVGSVANVIYAFLTLGILAVMIWQNHRFSQQIRATHQGNIFSALVRVHEILGSERSRHIRGYLHQKFTNHLIGVIGEVLGEEYITVDAIGIRKIAIAKLLSGDLRKDHGDKEEFDVKLRNLSTEIESFKVNALEAVESTLADFELIAVFVYTKLEPAKEVVEVFGNLVLSTAPVILPFVAIQRQLCGQRDPRHRISYLRLLKEIIEMDRELAKKYLDKEEDLLEPFLDWINVELTE